MNNYCVFFLTFALLSSCVSALYEAEVGQSEWHVPLIGAPRLALFSPSASSSSKESQALIVASEGFLALLNPSNGSFVWRKSTAAPIVGLRSGGGSDVLSLDANGELMSRSHSTGLSRWASFLTLPEAESEESSATTSIVVPVGFTSAGAVALQLTASTDAAGIPCVDGAAAPVVTVLTWPLVETAGRSASKVTAPPPGLLEPPQSVSAPRIANALRAAVATLAGAGASGACGASAIAGLVRRVVGATECGLVLSTEFPSADNVPLFLEPLSYSHRISSVSGAHGATEDCLVAVTRSSLASLSGCVALRLWNEQHHACGDLVSGGPLQYYTVAPSQSGSNDGAGAVYAGSVSAIDASTPAAVVHDGSKCMDASTAKSGVLGCPAAYPIIPPGPIASLTFDHCAFDVAKPDGTRTALCVSWDRVVGLFRCKGFDCSRVAAPIWMRDEALSAIAAAVVQPLHHKGVPGSPKTAIAYGDHFGLTQAVVIVSSVGSVRALRSFPTPGLRMWALPALPAVCGSVFRAKLSLLPSHLAPTRAATITVSTPSCVVLLDAATGALLETTAVAPKYPMLVLSSPPSDLPIPLALDCAGSGAGEVLGSVATAEQILSRNPVHTWAKDKEGSLVGYAVSAAGATAACKEVWRLGLRSAAEETILNVFTPLPTALVTNTLQRQYRTILANGTQVSNFQTKRILHNTLLVASMGLISNSSAIIMRAIDAISGSIIASMVHEDAAGPVTMTAFENTVVYSFFSKKKARHRIGCWSLSDTTFVAPTSVIRAFFASKRPRELSTALLPPPGVTATGFQFNHAITVLVPTVTRLGVSPKRLMIGTSSGRVFNADPRRFDFGHEGQFDLPLNSTINYYHLVSGLRGAVVASTALETHNVVFFWGADVFLAVVAPQKPFDKLGEDFGYAPLLISCVVITLIVGILWFLYSRKVVAAHWA